MTEMTLTHATQIFVKEMTLITRSGQKIDLTGIYQELNLFDNLFTPCCSGNILLVDANNIVEKFKFDGNEKMRFSLSKDNSDTMKYEKEFVIYKMSNMKNINLSSKSYILHFVSAEFIVSEQKKVSINYRGTYSAMVQKILNDTLKVSGTPSQGKGGIGMIEASYGNNDLVIPTITPLNAINWICKRSITSDQTPDYVFFETAKKGYNFVSLSYLKSQPSIFEFHFNPKNLGDKGSEFFGVRDMKVLSSFSLMDNIRDGTYSGKFIGFDTLTKTMSVTKVKPAIDTTTNYVNKDNESYYNMENAKIVSYPYEMPRANVEYMKKNNPVEVNYMNNTEDYVFQRKRIFTNLLQKRLQLLLSGNFLLYSGTMVKLNVPSYSQKGDSSDSYDKTLTGDYLVIGTRHIIKYNKHETLIEVVTDETEQ